MAESSSTSEKDAYIEKLEAQIKEMNEEKQAAKADEAKKATAALKAFQSCHAPEYHGSSDPTVTERWIRTMELVFETCRCEDSKKVTFARTMLRGAAIQWWDTVGVSSEQLSWDEFLVILRKKYCSDYDMERLEQEFLTLKKGDKPVDDLIYKFSDRMRFVAHLLPTEKAKISRFANTLPPDYRAMVRFATTLDMAFDTARQIENDFKQKREQQGGQFKRKFDQLSEAKKSVGGKAGGTSSSSQTGARKTTWCARCRSSHSGPCSKETARCLRCGQQGHGINECSFKESVCYKCHKPGHQIKECTAGTDKQSGGSSSGQRKEGPPRAKGRAFQMTEEEARTSG